MCDQDLMGRERTGVVLVDVGLGPKEGDLKSQRLAMLGGQPAGDIPPLGAKLRVAAEVRRKYQRMIPDDRRIRRGGGRVRWSQGREGHDARRRRRSGGASSLRYGEQACGPSRA